MSKVVFKKIKNNGIFCEDFECLNERGHGEISFSPMGIAVLYAPNGTGKSSLAKVLSKTQSDDNFDFKADFDGLEVTPSNNVFHIIGDQISRNIIHGDTADYLIGQNIKREYDLIKIVNDGFTNLFGNTLSQKLKEIYSVSKKGDYLVKKVCSMDTEAGRYIESIVNRSKKGQDINRDDFVNYVTTKITQNANIEDEEKRKFITDDCANEKIIDLLINVDLDQAHSSREVRQIEQNDDAIFIANKYKNLSECIVCDNKDFNAQNIITRKEKNKKKVYDSLSPETKKIFDSILKNVRLSQTDPFDIRKIVLDFIESGNRENIEQLRLDLEQYIDSVVKSMIYLLKESFEQANILASYSELKELQQNVPEIDEEDLLLIKEIVSNNIEKDITIERVGDGKNFKLLLAGEDFLGVDREKLQLSTGEQNFISLSFELLLARQFDEKIVVLDDPISSFDSVYKNKIAYCIVKFLEKQKQIILTHNTDLIKLLEFQRNNCFNLYLFNNTDDGENGFIPICQEEKDILINLHKLLKLFRNEERELEENILDRRLFLMAMIPFMRGYAHILSDGNDIYCKLSELMHGYTNASENVSVIYEELFDYHFEDIDVSTTDVIGLDCSALSIMNSDKYPLLAETLRQTLIYYHLRMLVEKTLVGRFDLPTNGEETLAQIINKAFPMRACADVEENKKRKENRVFFTSRKTLVNEFNHFEGNMNIFQPAIDISKQALDKEVRTIKERLEHL